MIVVYGTVCRDRIHKVAKLPEPGGYEEIEAEFDSAGGEALNTALALHRWGKEVALAGNSMGTPQGTQLIAETGLSTQHLPNISHLEPVCDIYVTPDGQRTMFGRGFRSLEQWANPSEVPLLANHWLAVDANHGSGAVSVAQSAQEAGMLVYVEDLTEPSTPEFDVWQSSTDWVAKRGDIQFNVRWLERWVLERGGFSVLSDGANGFVAGGCLGGEQRSVRHYPPFPCPRLVDSTGAGDIFRAGMLRGLSSGWSLSECLQFASAAGSLNCMGYGAISAIPTEEEVHKLVKDHPEIARNYVQ